MADTKLYRQLWREIQKQDGRLTESTGAFVDRLVRKLRGEGWQIGPAAEAELTDYLQRMRTAVGSGIETALNVAVAAGVLQSDAVSTLAEDAFNRRWPDGLNLSRRLWNFDRETRIGLTDVLQKGVRQGAATSRIVMDMQRSIERNAGRRFAIVQQHKDDWVKRLHQAGQDLIHNPDARDKWNTVVAEVEDRIATLAQTGSRSAAEQVLKEMRRAVDKGREDLLDNAARWWTFDRQLYGLKRIARTEMSTAMHRAVIAGSRDDQDVIGYQWRLSSSHPRPDICDYYAGIEMGMGKGVWSKDAVPDEKAHPHCMCLLIPRVSPIKQRGSHNFRDFIDNSTPEQRDKLLPKWAQRLHALGRSMDDLVRPDGRWTMSKKTMLERMGKERFAAAQAIGRAALEKDFRLLDMTTHQKASRRFFDDLQPFKNQRPVAALLKQMLEHPSRVDGRLQHYVKRRYLDESFDFPISDMDKLFADIVTDPGSRIHGRPGGRYKIRSTTRGWIAIIEVNGRRVSLYPDNDDELGPMLWTIKALLD